MSWFNKKAKPNGADDEDLLRSYKLSGDLAFLGSLFEKYTPLIYGVCLKYLKDEEGSKDAVMQIFEELVTKAKTHDVNNFRSWIYVLSRNYCLMQIRSAGKFEQVNMDDVLESAFIPQAENEINEIGLKALEHCITTLNEQQQQVIRLFYIEERSYKEITAHTGFTLNEVKSFIQNGKRNLKICLEKRSGH